MTHKPATLPIIDLRELDNPETRADFYRKLRTTARDSGFFYLIGHGISREERSQLLHTVQRFFDLPTEEKRKTSMSGSRHFRGYSTDREELTRGLPDYREQLDIGEELPARDLSESHDIWLNLIGPNLWPEKIPELKTAALDWQQKNRALAVKLIKAFLTALEIPETGLDSILSGPPQHLLKLIHYPSIPAEAGSNQGVGPHKDAGLLTLLWQDGTGGLQVQTEDGWIDIPPLEDAFVINIGETLELATNGYLRANVHQVVRPAGGTSRYSIAYFITPSVLAEEIPLLPLPAHLSALARGPESDPLNPLFGHPGKNSIKGRLRSHPAVTRRFYPEQYALIQEHRNII